MKSLIIAALVLCPEILSAAQHSGSVRAADQFLPGATVTARQGGAKLVAYTDGNGRYTLDLTPGVWELEVELFGFRTQRAEVTVTSTSSERDWTLEMPRLGEAAVEPVKTPAKTAPAPAVSIPAASSRPLPDSNGSVKTPSAAEARPSGSGRSGQARTSGRDGASMQRGGGRGGRGNPQQPPQRPGFQNMPVTATEAGAQELATATEPPVTEESAESSDAFVVSGSMSGGLEAAADDQMRRDRLQGGRGGRGGPDGGMGPMGAGINEMIAFNGGPGADPLGMNGFGAAGVNTGFGGDFGGGPGAGGPGGGGRGGGGGGGGRGGGGGPAARFGGGGGGRVGAGGPGGGRGGRGGGRGPNNGQFARFGNRRRTQPAYTGSFTYTGRNSVLDARPFSLNGQNAVKASYAQNNFGFNIGGPLHIPKLLNLEHSMIFFTYQGARSRNPYNQVATLPSAAERGGDFSQAAVGAGPVTVFDPLSGAPFPGNIIPSYRFSPAAAGLLKFMPLPTYPQLALQNYQIVTSSSNSSNNYGIRFNDPLTRRDRVNFNVQIQGRDGTNPQLFGYRDDSTGSGMSAQAGYNHSFAPRFNSSLNWNFSRNNSKLAPYFAYTNNVAAELGITGTSQDPINYGPPNLSFTNFGGLSDGSASVTRNQTSNITEAITLVRKKHNLTFGAGYRRLQQNSLTYANARGSFTFSGLLTSGFDANGNPQKQTGFDFADFLLGLPQSSSLRFGSDNNYFRSWAINGYAQDDWRIRSNLTINVGLRYEYFAPYTELHGHLANLDISPQFNAVTVVTPGQPGPYSGDLPASLVRSDPNNFSPRLGISWKPNPKKSLTLRGGYSLFFNGSNYQQFASRMASQPPFAKTASLSTSLTSPLTIQNGFPDSPSQTITNTFAVDPNYRLGYAQTWNFAVQESLPHNTIIEIEYLGTKGTGLDILRQPNRATPGSPLTAQQRLQIGNATGFSYETSQGNSIFHAGQVRISRRLVRGISANVLYTFSKSIDNASSFGGGGGVVAQNDRDLHLERGLSTFDQRHHLTLNYVLTSPVGGARGWFRNKNAPKKLFAGWTLTGGFTATSGTPLTARVSGNLSNTGGTGAFGAGRAQATGLPVDADGYAYFNPLAFTTPPAGEYGDAGRNTIPGLFRTSLNASFGRAFRFEGTRRTLQLRLNANNVMNHVAITNIGTTVNSSNYGLPTAASQTRSVTLTMRFNF